MTEKNKIKGPPILIKPGAKLSIEINPASVLKFREVLYEIISRKEILPLLPAEELQAQTKVIRELQTAYGVLFDFHLDKTGIRKKINEYNIEIKDVSVDLFTERILIVLGDSFPLVLNKK